ncbi:hypothetical protein J5Y03_15145 [Bacillus sp. RG28]|uniref:Uncharacterized protein n=1 Tax=Gottfriedia endophytica TaxID=2820819 RepID=A0A940NRK6_9BACI|nr:hypothetical protein [Gottfriedia endophytica]MBP0726495.1 hypothetical protein [Gottfriedia endophytica]
MEQKDKLYKESNQIVRQVTHFIMNEELFETIVEKLTTFLFIFLLVIGIPFFIHIILQLI